MADDDNISYFASPTFGAPLTVRGTQEGLLTFTTNGTTPALIIKPDGTKLRGSDQKPLIDLEAKELREVIDALVCSLSKR